MPTSHQSKDKDQGFILVDTLISIVILGIAFLGIFSSFEAIQDSVFSYNEQVKEVSKKSNQIYVELFE